MKRRLLFEAEDDNDKAFSQANNQNNDTQQNNETEDNKTDDTENVNTADNNENKTDDNQNNDGEDQNNTDENQEENNDELTDDDLTIKEPEEDTDDNKEADTTDNTEEDTTSDDTSDTVTDSPAKEAERQLFDSLSPEEQAIKNNMLKKLYIELYTNCNNIIDKLNNIGSELDEVNPQIKRVLALLFNLKQMIDDYLTNIYKTKSYIENDIMFNRYLSVLNSVKNIIKDINNYYEDDTKKS